MMARTKAVLVMNNDTQGILTFNSCKEAAQHLDRHPSTLSRAMTGDRGCFTVNGHVAVAIEGLETTRV